MSHKNLGPIGSAVYEIHNKYTMALPIEEMWLKTVRA